jgi:hypothetical protein
VKNRGVIRKQQYLRNCPKKETLWEMRARKIKIKREGAPLILIKQREDGPRRSIKNLYKVIILIKKIY